MRKGGGGRGAGGKREGQSAVPHGERNNASVTQDICVQGVGIEGDIKELEINE